MLLRRWDPPGTWNSSPKGEVKRACLPALSRLGLWILKVISTEKAICVPTVRRGQDPTAPYRLLVRVSHGPNAQLEAALSISIKWAGQLPPKKEDPWLHTNKEDRRTCFSRLSLQTFSKRRKVYRDLGLAKRGASGGMEPLRIARVGGSDLESFIAQKIKINTHTQKETLLGSTSLEMACSPSKC